MYVCVWTTTTITTNQLINSQHTPIARRQHLPCKNKPFGNAVNPNRMCDGDADGGAIDSSEGRLFLAPCALSATTPDLPHDLLLIWTARLPVFPFVRPFGHYTAQSEHPM